MSKTIAIFMTTTTFSGIFRREFSPTEISQFGRKERGFPLDPSMPKETAIYSGKLGIDATRKHHYPPRSMPPAEFDAKSARSVGWIRLQIIWLGDPSFGEAGTYPPLRSALCSGSGNRSLLVADLVSENADVLTSFAFCQVGISLF